MRRRPFQERYPAGRLGRLHRDHPYARIDGLGHDAGAGGPAAPTQGNKDVLHLRKVLDHLQGLGGHPCNEQELVGGVDESVAFLNGQAFAVLPGLVEVLAVEDQLRSQVAHGLHLQWVGANWQPDDGPGPEEPAGIGDGLAVVARGGGDHPAVPLLLAHMGQQVYPASYLERAQGLVVLVLANSG